MATIRWCPIFPKWDSYQPLTSNLPCLVFQSIFSTSRIMSSVAATIERCCNGVLRHGWRAALQAPAARGFTRTCGAGEIAQWCWAGKYGSNTLFVRVYVNWGWMVTGKIWRKPCVLQSIYTHTHFENRFRMMGWLAAAVAAVPGPKRVKKQPEETAFWYYFGWVRLFQEWPAQSVGCRWWFWLRCRGQVFLSLAPWPCDGSWSWDAAGKGHPNSLVAYQLKGKIHRWWIIFRGKTMDFQLYVSLPGWVWSMHLPL